jgi:hypothetical protein
VAQAKGHSPFLPGTLVQTQSAGLSSRVEQVPGTPLTLRAGLLSGRAYRHFVYKMTTESLQSGCPRCC